MTRFDIIGILFITLAIPRDNHQVMAKHLLIILLLLICASFRSVAQTRGCTDRLAINYNPSATINDGSCVYNPVNLKPVASRSLPAVIAETSGLIIWNGLLWTHNDNNDTNLYALDTVYGNIADIYPLRNVKNTDWEEISQDDGYLYIGDFGNNYGNRTDLHILRISKSSMAGNTPRTDTISFSYSDQVSFSQNDANNTDFDCEAFIVSADSIFLFTKQWNSRGTGVYSLPKIPGNYIARLRNSYGVKGLVTGAVFLESRKLLVLSGYSKTLDPFLFLLYDFKGNDFFGGNKRRIELQLPSHQVEGITSSDGIKYYITNEHFSLPPLINTNQKIHILNLSWYLGNYLGLNIPLPDAEKNYILSPVPVHDQLTVRSLAELVPSGYTLVNMSGRIMMTGILESGESMIDLSGLSPGAYILKIGDEKRNSYKLIKD
jgi:hypothetical protein